MKIVGVFNDCTGYGVLGEQIYQSFVRAGISVFKEDISNYAPTTDTVLLVQPPWVSIPISGPLIWFTMLESTGMGSISLLNRADKVIVPSSFSSSTLLARGLCTPIYHCPLWADFKPNTPKDYSSNCKFGYIARVYDGGSRKNIDFLIEAFLEAFASFSLVKLSIKKDPHSPKIQISDPRVEIISEDWSAEKLTIWESTLDVYVSPSRGEGWGFCTANALGAGIPVISTMETGMKEYFSEIGGWPLDFNWVPVDSDSTINYGGYWASPTKSSLIKALKESSIYRNRIQKNPFLCVRSYTRERFMSNIVRICQE